MGLYEPISELSFNIDGCIVNIIIYNHYDNLDEIASYINKNINSIHTPQELILHFLQVYKDDKGVTINIHSSELADYMINVDAGLDIKINYSYRNYLFVLDNLLIGKPFSELCKMSLEKVSSWIKEFSDESYYHSTQVIEYPEFALIITNQKIRELNRYGCFNIDNFIDNKCAYKILNIDEVENSIVKSKIADKLACFTVEEYDVFNKGVILSPVKHY